MNEYKKAIQILKTSPIRLYVYKNQVETSIENQPTIYDFFHSEISMLEELVQEYEKLKSKEEPKQMMLNVKAKPKCVALREYICPVCGVNVYGHHKYCWNCGQAVKRD